MYIYSLLDEHAEDVLIRRDQCCWTFQGGMFDQSINIQLLSPGYSDWKFDIDQNVKERFWLWVEDNSIKAVIEKIMINIDDTEDESGSSMFSIEVIFFENHMIYKKFSKLVWSENVIYSSFSTYERQHN